MILLQVHEHCILCNNINILCYYMLGFMMFLHILKAYTFLAYYLAFQKNPCQQYKPTKTIN